MRRHFCTPFAAVLADDVRRVDRQTPVRVDDDAEQSGVRLQTRTTLSYICTYIRQFLGGPKITVDLPRQRR